MCKKFSNAYKFLNNYINKFIFLLGKSTYPYKYMESSKTFDETSLPDKKAFYCKLFQEEITDKDYTNAQKLFKEIKLKNLGEYHDLYVQSDTLLLVDMFQSCRNECDKIYE